MHRQSLGSPAAKLHANGVIIIKETSSSSPSSSSSSSSVLLLPQNDDEDEKQKNKKPHHKMTPSGHNEKFIHLIPVLTLLCIFILYLNSHDPSQNDLAQFNGFKASSKAMDTTKIERVLEIEKGDVLAIRSMRNLQEADKENSRFRINRKIGDF